MTTIIGISGKDKKTGESYVVLASDRLVCSKSMLVNEDIYNPDLSARKIISPADEEYIFAFRGFPLHETYLQVREGKIKDKTMQELATHYNRLARIEELYDSGYGEVLPDELINGDCSVVKLINECLMGKDHRPTQFIFGLRESLDVNMYVTFPGGDTERRGYCSFGTGSPHAIQTLGFHLRNDHAAELDVSICDAKQIALEALLHAEQYDPFTKGKDMVVMLASGNRSYRTELKDCPVELPE